MPFDDTLLANAVHGFVDNQGVRLHYVTMGEGPLLVMLHGFPDFWYTWRYQLVGLASDFQVVAMDLRGYNESDKPTGQDAYKLPVLASDVIALVHQLGFQQAVIAGNDWGGLIAWHLAIYHPVLVHRLIICNLPHPNGLLRELAHNPAQQRASQYARNFQQPDYHRVLTAERLTDWINDPDVRALYIEALERSDFAAMLAYYQANYPREPYSQRAAPVPKVQSPVLMIHGLQDWALLPGALNDTWQWLESDLTLVTLPNAGHFVQQDAHDLVTRTMRMWLNR